MSRGVWVGKMYIVHFWIMKGMLCGRPCLRSEVVLCDFVVGLLEPYGSPSRTAMLPIQLYRGIDRHHSFFSMPALPLQLSKLYNTSFSYQFHEILDEIVPQSYCLKERAQSTSSPEAEQLTTHSILNKNRAHWTQEVGGRANGRELQFAEFQLPQTKIWARSQEEGIKTNSLIHWKFEFWCQHALVFYQQDKVFQMPGSQMWRETAMKLEKNLRNRMAEMVFSNADVRACSSKPWRSIYFAMNAWSSILEPIKRQYELKSYKSIHKLICDKCLGLKWSLQCLKWSLKYLKWSLRCLKWSFT